MLNRRIVSCLCLLCALLFISQAAADELPTRSRFSLGYVRLSESVAKGRPIGWKATIQPDAPDGSVAAAFVRVLGVLEFSGIIQCFLEGGGWLDAQIAEDGRQIASIEQLTRDGRVSLSIGDGWVSIGADERYELSMLTTDALGEFLFALDYESIRRGTVPMLTAIVGSGMQLWELASPWSDDNQYLQVSQGPTSHGTTYNIDTAGLRSILNDWADSLSRDVFSFGIPGADLAFGMDDAMFDAFVGRVRQLAASAEMSERLKVNLAFGEGDFLQRARGSGAIRTPGGSKGISYDYTASRDNRKMSSRQQINFQPIGADTIVLDVRRSSSSNGKDTAKNSVSASVRGMFDGKPYSFEYKADMENGYAVSDGLLAEVITGSVSCRLEYDKRLVLDVQLTRGGATKSYAMKNALEIEDTYHAVIATEQGTLFSGMIALNFQIAEQPEQPPEGDGAQPIEAMDFLEIEAFRGTLARMLEGTRESLAGIPWRGHLN